MRQTGTLAFLALLLAPLVSAECQDRITPCSPWSVCTNLGAAQVCGTTEYASGGCLKQLTGGNSGAVRVGFIS
ncbi:uncharacterized protein CTRU02_205620 [Colletotrichum truncatum]|uniref:Uncharacterized protein n=1 Tax=Colletotrichum truncatum TaxID=5467 RepID=A0ACC3Z4M7_COLTU